MKMHRENYDKLKTTQQKRVYALKYITDDKYIEILKYEKISLSTIDIAFKVFLEEKVVFKKTNSNIFKEHKTF
tara:strand:+ start:1037 stop:1255 length:219 start_codon:yes stop_codon:yes gene_type:complete